MGLNKSFAEILKQKITIGSTRSILLNSIPGKLATRLPLSDLEFIEKGLSYDLINKLTSINSFSIKFTIDLSKKQDEQTKVLTKIQKRLTAIKYEHDDYFKEHGVETFGFGFPILLRKNIKDPTKYIAAPLFIFPLDIVQSYDKAREWIISRSSDSEIRLNEVFSSYTENEEHLKIPVLPEEMLEDGLLDKNEIETFCKTLLTKFENSKYATPNWNKLDVIPEKLVANDILLANTKILWNGVFGLFKSQKQSQIKEMELLLESYDEIAERTSEFSWENSHSPVITDPSQNLAIRSLTTNKDLVIQGPPGTGKSQTLTAIISSALANNKKVLIVCEKRTALEVLKNNLIEIIPDLSKCIALIEDVHRDRTNIVETVRNRTAKHLVNLHLRSILEDNINRFEDKANLIEKQYNNLRTPIWRNLKWKDLVSKWISKIRTVDDINWLYKLQRLFQEQKLNDNEFSKLKSVIDDAANVYNKAANDFSFF